MKQALLGAGLASAVLLFLGATAPQGGKPDFLPDVGISVKVTLTTGETVAGHVIRSEADGVTLTVDWSEGSREVNRKEASRRSQLIINPAHIVDHRFLLSKPK